MRDEFFPREVTTKAPLVTLTGRERLQVEQHMGLVDYETENIVLRTSAGLMRISGAGMVFQRYSAQEAVVTGRIDSEVFGQGGQ